VPVDVIETAPSVKGVGIVTVPVNVGEARGAHPVQAARICAAVAIVGTPVEVVLRSSPVARPESRVPFSPTTIAAFEPLVVTSPLNSLAAGVVPSRRIPVPALELLRPPFARATTPVTFAAVPVVF
jgi:hypothetical protein